MASNEELKRKLEILNTLKQEFDTVLEGGDLRKARELQKELQQRTDDLSRTLLQKGQMKQHDQVVPVLKQRLAVEDDGDVIEESVKALEQWQALDDEVFETLKLRLNEEKSSVRRRVVEALPKFKHHRSEVASLLKQRLETDDNPYIIRSVIIASHKIGMTIEQMSRLLARNPNFPRWWGHHPRHNWPHLLHQGGIVAQVVERTLRLWWWRLYPRRRRSFDLSWTWDEHWWHHCPECHMMWRELVHLLERDGGGRQEAEWLLAAMGHWWGNPRWAFGCHDFEELMSLRVEQNVIYEEVNTLRFRFLDAFATDGEGRPIGELARGWLRQFQQDWDELLRTEEQFDRIRDEISDLRRQQEEIIQEMERRTEGEWRWERGEPPRLPEDLQGRWNEVAEHLRRLEGDEEPGELQRLRRALEDATERLLPQLRERGARFKVIEVEGVLGEYNFFERKVTLYQPMIVLAAADLKDSVNRDEQEIYDALYTVVEMHETAHATAHLGLDSDSNMWDEPERGTSELHETIAQYYTFKLIEKLEDRSLEEVFLALNEEQPERYKFWRYLKDLSPNRVRDFLMGKRIGWFRWDLLSIAHRTAQVLGNSASLLKTCLSQVEFDTFMGGLAPIAARFENAQSLPAVCEAAEELIQHCETHPFVKELLELAIPRGLHAPVYRALLLVSNLVEGEPTKGPTLRLTIDQIINAQTLSLTASQLLLRNEIIHGLRAAPELEVYTAHDKAQELAKYLPEDRDEALRLVEELSQIVRSE